MDSGEAFRTDEHLLPPLRPEHLRRAQGFCPDVRLIHLD